MMGFFKFMWNEYQKQRKVEDVCRKQQDMMNNMKKLGKEEFKAKYNGNPSRMWALLQYEKLVAEGKVPSRMNNKETSERK